MKSAFVKTMLVLVFLALVANVVITAVKGQSFLTKEAITVLAFGAIVVANFSIAGAALYFTSKAEQKNQRSHRKWARRGFVGNLGFTALFGAGPWIFQFKGQTLDDMFWNCGFILLLFGALNALFTLSAYRDFVRAVGTYDAPVESRRRRKSSNRKRPESSESAWDE